MQKLRNLSANELKCFELGAHAYPVPMSEAQVEFFIRKYRTGKAHNADLPIEDAFVARLAGHNAYWRERLGVDDIRKEHQSDTTADKPVLDANWQIQHSADAFVAICDCKIARQSDLRISLPCTSISEGQQKLSQRLTSLAKANGKQNIIINISEPIGKISVIEPAPPAIDWEIWLNSMLGRLELARLVMHKRKLISYANEYRKQAVGRFSSLQELEAHIILNASPITKHN